MKNKFFRLEIVLLSLSLLFLLMGCSSSESNNNDNENPSNDNQNNNQDTLIVSDLEIGDKIIDMSWDWEFRQGSEYTVYSENEVTEPVSWIVVAKDHYQPNSITLVSEYLIGFYIFDNSMLESGLLAGQGHWGNSGLNNGKGLRPWLNSTGPHDGEGFYQAFSSDFKSIIIPTTLDNVVWDTKETYTTQDNVFIPSLTEFGAKQEELNDSFVLGEAYPYFVDADYTILETDIKNGFSYDYWARNTFERGYRLVGMITTSGIYVDWFADSNYLGVRPALTIRSSTKISSTPNEQGYYEIIFD